jgi:chromosome partitioning protein
VVQDLTAFFERARGTATPWANAHIFESRIRRNVKLAECPSFGKSIFAYAPHCNGAEDYAALAREVMGEAPAEVLTARVELDERGQVSVLSVERQDAPAS